MLNSPRIIRKRGSNASNSPRNIPKAAGLAAFGKDIL